MEGQLMRPLATKITGACAALLLGGAITFAQAPDTNNMTTVTFSAPVSLPGVTLPAGSYLFRLADSKVNRNIVQVFDKDRSKIFATILAIPAERNEPADETVITFNESPANTAPAVRYWYYPGDRRGQEFAYPKKQAIEIANAAHTSVLSVDMDENNPDSMKTGAMSRVEPGAEPSAAAPSPTQEPTPQAAPPTPQTPQAEPAPAQPPAQPSEPQPTAKREEPAAQQPQTPSPAPAPSATPSTPQSERPVGTSGSTPAREHLPKTASPLPLVGFAGLLALVGALSIRTLRRERL
jgi:hypothetical protein